MIVDGFVQMSGLAEDLTAVFHRKCSVSAIRRYHSGHL